MENVVRLTVGDFIALTNQTLEYAYQGIEVEGEVASFKVNQGKFVFFDLKDSEGSIGCFMMVFSLRIPIEDGMKVIVRATPKLTKWGKFSLTVQTIRPSGEGSLKKSFELLKAKLDKEGLFAPERKRSLPAIPERIAVISSIQAAGYQDFITILNERWGNIDISVAHVQVQGETAPDQMIRALAHFNQLELLPEVIVIVRGGGSADDLASFNDELLVRAVAASRVPTLTGIGHDIDESLVDLAADVEAATPSNAAQRLVPDKHDTIRHLKRSLIDIAGSVDRSIESTKRDNVQLLEQARETILHQVERSTDRLESLTHVLAAYNPRRALERGYSILRGKHKVGERIAIETVQSVITAEVIDVTSK